MRRRRGLWLLMWGIGMERRKKRREVIMKESKKVNGMRNGNRSWMI